MSKPYSPTPVGVFDSGCGGLTVAASLSEFIPQLPLIYLGDTARVPYGNKSPETVRRYSLNIARMLETKGIQALVIACNTATAHALDALQEALSIPVFGVVEPVAERALALTKSEHIAVLGTRGTVASGAYPRALERLGGKVRCSQLACPLFVPLADEGWTDGDVATAVARAYLEDLRGTDVDTLILGCTHYPLLADVILSVACDVMDRDVVVLDCAQATARKVEEALQLPPGEAAGHRFLFTDYSPSYAEACARFFGKDISDIEHVDVTPFAG